MKVLFHTILCSWLFSIGLGDLSLPPSLRARQSDQSSSSSTSSTTTKPPLRHDSSPPPSSETEGVSIHVVGGQATDAQRYSYTVSLQDPSGYHLCGGTVVAPDIILSAGHCADAGITTAVVGVYDLSDLSSGNIEVFAFKKMYLHPDYNDATTDYDALIIKLDGIITVTDPVRINNDYSLPNPSNVLTVVGWGATSDDGAVYPTLQQEADLFYVSNRLCKRITDDNGYSYGSELFDDMMCASDYGKSACFGDSGGPLLLLGATPWDDIQIGVVSFGVDCASPIPSVYHRISHSYEWIRTMVCSRSAAPPDYFSCF